MQTCWLASYPKSGNTWFRIFLSNLVFPELAPVDPNQLPLSNLIASARGPFEEIIDVKSSMLTVKESSSLRPALDQIIARDWRGPICVRKAHDAYTYLPDGKPLMGRGPEVKAIYILRNPWDVAVSAANHWDKGTEETINIMLRKERKQTGQSDINEQFPQQLLSWSDHAIGWLKSPMELCLIRYEDMHGSPLSTFRTAVKFLGLNYSDKEISNAIAASAFKRLQEIEAEVGFAETPREKTKFFRCGSIGDGLGALNQNQLDRLQAENDRVNKAIGQYCSYI